jgi:hypothetical protein
MIEHNRTDALMERMFSAVYVLSLMDQCAIFIFARNVLIVVRLYDIINT